MIESEHPIERKEGKPAIKMPIIDIIRHGSTKYRELLDTSFRFDPNSSEFNFDPHELDLTDEGIREITATAEQLAQMIDKDNEAVILISSEAPRSMSSILIIEKILSDRGITILNQGDVKRSSQLRQMSFRDKGAARPWFNKQAEYVADPANTGKPPEVFHTEMAASFGKTIADFFTENYDHFEERFRRFLKHMINLNESLQDETKERIGNRRLRIICLTHGEVPARFITQTFGSRERIRKSQILEFQPSDELNEKKTRQTRVILYQKGDSEQKEASLEI